MSNLFRFRIFRIIILPTAIIWFIFLSYSGFTQNQPATTPTDVSTNESTDENTPTNSKAGKLPQGIEVLAEVGLGGVCHLGRVNPVSVMVANRNTESIFSCTVELMSDIDTYTNNVNVAAGDTVATTFFVDLDPPPGSLVINLKSGTGRSLFLRKYDFKQAIGAEDALILVVTDQPGILSYLDQTPVITKSQAYLGSTANMLQPGMLSVAYISLERLLDMGLRSLSPIDGLIIHSGDFSRISENDLKSLEAFTAAGGVLITSAGIDGKKLSESALSAVLPMKTDTAEPSSEITGLSGFAHTKMPASASAIVASGGTIRNDAEILAGSDAKPLIVARPYGFGRIIQMNFDFAQPSVRGWQGWTPLWRKILIPALSSAGVENKMFLPGKVLDSLSRIPQTKPIPLALASLFIVIYIILVGPVNYAVLARRKKRTLLWVSIPAVVIAFGLFSVMLGYFWRGTSNILRSIDEIHHFEGIPVTVARNYTMYFSSASGTDTATVNAPEAIIRTLSPPIPDQNYYWSYNQPRSEEKKPGRISYSPVPALERRLNKWTPYNLWTEFIDEPDDYNVSFATGSEPKLNYSLESPVSDSWIWSNNGNYHIGKLGNTGEIVLNKQSQYSGSTGRDSGSISEISSNLVGSLFDTRNLGTDATCSLITYIDRTKERFEFERSYIKESATFDFYHTKRTDWSVTDPQVIIEVSDFMSTKKVPAPRTTGYGNPGNSGIITINKDETITFHATVSPVDPNTTYTLKLYGVVLYNWQANDTLEYDIVISGNGFNDSQTSYKNEQYEIQIPGRALTGDGLDITIGAKCSLSIVTVEVAPLKSAPVR